MDHHLIQHPTYFSGGTSTGKTPFQKLFIASGWGFLIRYYYLTDITIIINPISANFEEKIQEKIDLCFLEKDCPPSFMLPPILPMRDFHINIPYQHSTSHQLVLARP